MWTGQASTAKPQCKADINPMVYSGPTLPVLGVQSCLLALVLIPIWPCIAPWCGKQLCEGPLTRWNSARTTVYWEPICKKSHLRDALNSPEDRGNTRYDNDNFSKSKHHCITLTHSSECCAVSAVMSTWYAWKARVTHLKQYRLSIEVREPSGRMVVASTGDWNLARMRSSADERRKSRVPGAQQGCGLEATMRCDSHDCVLYLMPYLQICALERCIESRRVRLKLSGQTAQPAQHPLENAGPFKYCASGNTCSPRALTCIGIGIRPPMAMPTFAHRRRHQLCRTTYARGTWCLSCRLPQHVALHIEKFWICHHSLCCSAIVLIVRLQGRHCNKEAWPYESAAKQTFPVTVMQHFSRSGRRQPLCWWEPMLCGSQWCLHMKFHTAASWCGKSYTAVRRSPRGTAMYHCAARQASVAAAMSHSWETSAPAMLAAGKPMLRSSL